MALNSQIRVKTLTGRKVLVPENTVTLQGVADAIELDVMSYLLAEQHDPLWTAKDTVNQFAGRHLYPHPKEVLDEVSSRLAAVDSSDGCSKSASVAPSSNGLFTISMSGLTCLL